MPIPAPQSINDFRSSINVTGVPKHHVCNANLMRNGADFSVFVNTAQVGLISSDRT